MAAAHYRFIPDRKYILHDPDKMPDRRFPGGDMLHALSMVSIQLAFLRHADRVKIGCMTGGLGALCASDHDHVWKSASHYAFMQLMQYARGTSMQTAIESETYDMPGYAIDDTSQYTGKEGVTFIDAASAWDKENDRLTIFVLNRHEETDYPLTVDISGFEGYTFEQHLELYSEDMEVSNSYEQPDLLHPTVSTAATVTNGCLSTRVKPLSWNVLTFVKNK